MGFFGTCFALMVGGACGVYIAQNYDVPNLRNLACYELSKVKHAEQCYRKPQQPQNKIINDVGQDVPQNKI